MGTRNHEISIYLRREELRQYQQSHQAGDGAISELKARLETLMGQVKGKGEASDATPEA